MQEHNVQAQSEISDTPYKLLVFTCYGGCATGVAASKACIRIWEENPADIKIGCLPAVKVPWKLKEITRKSDRRILIDACGVQCGAKLIASEGMTVDRYVELTSLLKTQKEKTLPSKDMEDIVYRIIRREVDALLSKMGKSEADSAGKEQRIHDAPDMLLKPVGVVKNEVNQPDLIARSGDLDYRSRQGQQNRRTRVSELVIDSSLDGILDGIENFSHLLVLYWAHLVDEGGRSIVRVHPMGRKDLPLVGIYASCSPARPNPVCAMVVRLLERKGNILKVQGLDAIDGSPLIDIKPFNPGYYAAENVTVADWMAQIYQEIDRGSDQKTEPI